MFFIWCAGELVSLLPCSVPWVMASCLVCECGGRRAEALWDGNPALETKCCSSHRRQVTSTHVTPYLNTQEPSCLAYGN